MTKHRLLAIIAVLVVTASLVVPALLAGTVRPYPDSGADADLERVRAPEDRFADLERLALDPNPVMLEFDQTPLEKVFHALSTATKVRFEFAGYFSQPVSVSYANLTPQEVLVRLGTAFQLHYEVVDAWNVRVSRAPLLAGVSGVTNPVLIHASKVEPEYPEKANEESVEGVVILQAVILSDGSVSDVEVLRSERPGMGFEGSAINAIKQWRYEPAKKNGDPVDVYFTIFVEFKLQ